MKQKNYRIEIPEPCGENWNLMSVNEHGRFCDSCSRSLIDFTNMSDAKLIQYLKTHPGKLCGRFRVDQVNRNLHDPKESRTLFSLPKMIGSLLLLAGNKELNAQERTNMPPFRIDIPVSSIDSTEFHFDDSCLDSISCHVLSLRYNKNLPFIKVYCPELNFKTYTDLNGKFNILIPENFEGKQLKIELSHEGFVPKIYTIYRENFKRKQTMYLLTNEVVITPSYHILGFVGH